MTNNNWTTEHMPDLSGKIAIVTGANSGIGYEATKEFIRKGAHTILACRSMDKAEAALDQIRSEIPNASAEVMELDLANQKSIRAFADNFNAKYDRLDILVNNAGIMAVPYGKTEDGFESQFGTNHLGHFALTGLLMKKIMATPNARVVSISSGAHTWGTMDFDNLMAESIDGYSAIPAYGNSKLANLLFIYELQRQFEEQGSDVMAVAAHPGGTNTNLQDEMFSPWYMKPLMPLMRLMMQDSDMGALPTLRAAADPRVTGGEYYGPGGFREIVGNPVLVQSNEASHDQEDARRLWEVSEELTGVEYRWPEHV